MWAADAAKWWCSDRRPLLKKPLSFSARHAAIFPSIEVEIHEIAAIISLWSVPSHVVANGAFVGVEVPHIIARGAVPLVLITVASAAIKYFLASCTLNGYKRVGAYSKRVAVGNWRLAGCTSVGVGIGGWQVAWRWDSEHGWHGWRWRRLRRLPWRRVWRRG